MYKFTSSENAVEKGGMDFCLITSTDREQLTTDQNTSQSKLILYLFRGKIECRMESLDTRGICMCVIGAFILSIYSSLPVIRN